MLKTKFIMYDLSSKIVNDNQDAVLHELSALAHGLYTGIKFVFFKRLL